MKPSVADIDQSILSVVHGDGRMSCAEIARHKGGTCVSTVSSTIRRVPGEGYINTGTIVFPESVGLDIVADVCIEAGPEQATATRRTARAGESFWSFGLENS